MSPENITASILETVRLSSLLASLALAACSTPSAPTARTPVDPTTEAWYAQTTGELTAIDRDAKESLQQGKPDAAAALILKGELLSKRLISVPHPTLAATIAASDLDELYGRMLLSNRNYGWARLFFQKNLVRWKYWQPQTPDSATRLKQAQDAIAECDRRIGN
jgi:hypothetical protein